MGNPYYIPQGEAPLSGLTKNIMALAELKQRGDLARQGLDMDRMRLEQGQQQIDLERGVQDFNREKFNADRPDLVKYDAGTHVKARTFLNTIGLNGSPVESFLNEAQTNGFTNGQVHAALRSPQMHGQIKEHIMSQLIKGQNTPGFSEGPTGQYLTQMLEGIDSPEDYDAFIDSVFPDVAQYNRALEAESRKGRKEPVPVWDDKARTWRHYDYQTGQEVAALAGTVPEKYKTGQEGNRARINAANINASSRLTAARINASTRGGGRGGSADGSREEKGAFTALQLKENEAKINSKDEKITPAERQTYIRAHNENAETPYFYAMTDGKTAKAYKLPEIQDDQNPGQMHQVTPKDITDTFRHYQKQGTKVKGTDGKERPITWADCYRMIVKKSQM
jgi:hypothetical protein